jgi:8-oxo-dGTP diphosphatase
MTARAVVDVAVGVLIRPDGRFLLASRPEGKPYSHYWEFPGGKLEPGETVAHALSRELHEELGVEIGEVFPWVVREFVYPHAHVRLHFCRVFEWSGEPHAREAQTFRFCTQEDLPGGPLLPATLPVMRWLGLPPVYALSNIAELGETEFLRRLELGLRRGLRFVEFREPALDRVAAERAFSAVLERSRSAGACLLVSSRHPEAWARAADGIQLTARDLMGSVRRPQVDWVAASAHAAHELDHAATIGVDFAVLGPVAKTASHPEMPGVGWNFFARVVSHSAVPVYAIGGLTQGDLDCARRAGAHGVALQRAAWPDH